MVIDAAHSADLLIAPTAAGGTSTTTVKEIGVYAVPASLGAAVLALWASLAVIQEVLTCFDAYA
ncbi:hypothetical protein [Streptomyces sp. NBC_00366]|uniref:hypothetical protein n=1 Tax=Streptomyces sp. NBC_00366 TaxID=2975727 RepID=UPI002E26FF30